MRDSRQSGRVRLVDTIAHVTGIAPTVGAGPWTVPLAQPDRVRDAIAECVEGRTVVVTGTLDRRLVLIEHEPGGTWTAADLSGQPHSTRTWPAWAADHLLIHDPDEWLSQAEISAEGVHRLSRPRLLLAALYHPEYFPLPRFPLAISDLARAVRTTLLGQVELLDMQLGAQLHHIVDRVDSGQVDILGISATFGQHDLMTELLDAVTTTDTPPMLVAGGSLTARNESMLLDRYPNLIISRGAGEPTIADVLSHWHKDLTMDQVRGVGYIGAPRGTGTMMIARRRNAVVPNLAQADILPELDLLDLTLTCNGVAQLEFSRGCTNFCSFCPRGHKGQWFGAAPESLRWMLREIGAVFDRHPHRSRTVYLVDEEFIGRGEDAVPRAFAAADMLAEEGLAWETSCRVDQVVRPDRDETWHRERAEMWRGLVTRGLRRCLFGVESGVTSILKRFNKETTGEQNALAIRTLTALGVPPRFTYITFDQLMTPAELHATHAFQGRTDLLVKPQLHLTAEEIVEGVRDEQWVAEHTTGRPFYYGISYMLVGMECLIGAAYTRQAEKEGLTGRPDPSMGRVEARYQDWRIGILARWAQLWIDRNFPLDYTLKSLEKILDGPAYERVRELRRVLKDAAYLLFGGMLNAMDATDVNATDRQELDEVCAAVVEAMIRELRGSLEPVVTAVCDDLPQEHRAILAREHDRWMLNYEWTLINAGDPCGT
ncbi:B12-binding domain-containing radical SAM protein [Lentzea indica]|uniref:B12-binding domain-containing radical SAM protein n=1 Tax=Lentzea indica TaxID=2604800 RepID=UPI001CB6E96E|nr:radical SAM protein [Lentzea indica]